MSSEIETRVRQLPQMTKNLGDEASSSAATTERESKGDHAQSIVGSARLVKIQSDSLVAGRSKTPSERSGVHRDRMEHINKKIAMARQRSALAENQMNSMLNISATTTSVDERNLPTFADEEDAKGHAFKPGQLYDISGKLKHGQTVSTSNLFSRVTSSGNLFSHNTSHDKYSTTCDPMEKMKENIDVADPLHRQQQLIIHNLERELKLSVDVFNSERSRLMHEIDSLRANQMLKSSSTFGSPIKEQQSNLFEDRPNNDLSQVESHEPSNFFSTDAREHLGSLRDELQKKFDADKQGYEDHISMLKSTIERLQREKADVHKQYTLAKCDIEAINLLRQDVEILEQTKEELYQKLSDEKAGRLRAEKKLKHSEEKCHTFQQKVDYNVTQMERDDQEIKLQYEAIDEIKKSRENLQNEYEELSRAFDDQSHTIQSLKSQLSQLESQEDIHLQLTEQQAKFDQQSKSLQDKLTEQKSKLWQLENENLSLEEKLTQKDIEMNKKTREFDEELNKYEHRMTEFEQDRNMCVQEIEFLRNNQQALDDLNSEIEALQAALQDLEDENRRLMEMNREYQETINQWNAKEVARVSTCVSPIKEFILTNSDSQHVLHNQEIQVGEGDVDVGEYYTSRGSSTTGSPIGKQQVVGGLGSQKPPVDFTRRLSCENDTLRTELENQRRHNAELSDKLVRAFQGSLSSPEKNVLRQERGLMDTKHREGLDFSGELTELRRVVENLQRENLVISKKHSEQLRYNHQLQLHLKKVVDERSGEVNQQQLQQQQLIGGRTETRELSPEIQEKSLEFLKSQTVLEPLSFRLSASRSMSQLERGKKLDINEMSISGGGGSRENTQVLAGSDLKNDHQDQRQKNEEERFQSLQQELEDLKFKVGKNMGMSVIRDKLERNEKKLDELETKMRRDIKIKGTRPHDDDGDDIDCTEDDFIAAYEDVRMTMKPTLSKRSLTDEGSPVATLRSRTPTRQQTSHSSRNGPRTPSGGSSLKNKMKTSSSKRSLRGVAGSKKLKR